MEIKEAMEKRHSVRQYLDRPLEKEVVEVLNEEIARCNSLSGLHIQLVRDEPLAFSTGIFKYGVFSGVKNYLVMAGKKGKENEMKVGYYGEHLVLLAQTLGLNTCWVGLTFKEIKEAFTLSEGEKLYCVIAIGYGANQGTPHPGKDFDEYIEGRKDVPEWFISGMKAVMLAPTAMNQRKFRFSFIGNRKVKARMVFSLIGSSYLDIDLGIVRYHFEIGAGKENFEWAE